MKLNLTTKMIGIIAVIAYYISFPFFKIKYFETSSSLKLIYYNLLIPIICLSVLVTIIIYIKYLRLLNAKANSKAKVVFQDLFTTTLLTVIVFAILIGITVSTIVTTNVYCGHSKDILVKGTVVEYSENTTKWGRLRHRIKFISSNVKELNDFEVFRKYEIGEEFKKEMKIGRWGQLYSKD